MRIERVPFVDEAVRLWGRADARHSNWPVTYVINGTDEIYVGESRNATRRMAQHLAAERNSSLTELRVIVDDTFNKSACLDLESRLIELLDGDNRFRVLNRNAGITNADYYNRAQYREAFREIFDQLRSEGLFTQGIDAIENSELFKLSPFKALTEGQASAVEDILTGFFDELDRGEQSLSVIEGAPGTGKTIVAIYLIKLLRDIGREGPLGEEESDSIFAEFFTPEHRAAAAKLRIGFVIPQQSLRSSVQRVFRHSPGLSNVRVLDPFAVGEDNAVFDLLIVDEAHRLNQRANQPSGVQNKRFTEINMRLFGADKDSYTQVDWIRARSTHQILLLDREQSVRPADLSDSAVRAILSEAAQARRRYSLTTQMRVRAGTDYVDYIRSVLAGDNPSLPDVGDYELRFFDDLGDMHDLLRVRETEHGLARLVAGFAWPWVSKRNPARFDIERDGRQLRWNSTAKDWINSRGALDEVGSIHTVQGYDLNYAGVIIGPELRYDTTQSRMTISRADYHDKKGKENNPRLGIVYSDADLQILINNVYRVLLTRGMRGTFVYVCDPELREYLRPFFTVIERPSGTPDSTGN